MWTPEAITDFEDAHINGPILDICLPPDIAITVSALYFYMLRTNCLYIYII